MSRCSPSTVHKAIARTDTLHKWANYEPTKEPKLRREGSITIAIEDTPQVKERDPSDVLDESDSERVLAKLRSQAKTDAQRAEIDRWLATADAEGRRKLVEAYDKQFDLDGHARGVI